ncbi:MAG: hypothetical protein LBU32_28675 [Clostridiales bacterium]|nr:hypothetical protein [Clostridiales bacterium]
MKVKVQDLVPGVVDGLDMHIPGSGVPVREKWYEWVPVAIEAQFQTCAVSGGVLKGWKHAPVFTDLEFYPDKRLVFVVMGCGIFPFADVKDGVVDMESVQLIRAKRGSKFVVPAYKASFAPVAENELEVICVIASARMEPKRIVLAEEIEGCS